MKKPSVTLALLCLLAIGWLGVHFASDWDGAVTSATADDGAALAEHPGDGRPGPRGRCADLPFPAWARCKPSTACWSRARVDGQIFKIDFAEGQEVRAGDILAELDPASLCSGARAGRGG